MGEEDGKKGRRISHGGKNIKSRNRWSGPKKGNKIMTSRRKEREKIKEMERKEGGERQQE